MPRSPLIPTLTVCGGSFAQLLPLRLSEHGMQLSTHFTKQHYTVGRQSCSRLGRSRDCRGVCRIIGHHSTHPVTGFGATLHERDCPITKTLSYRLHGLVLLYAEIEFPQVSHEWACCIAAPMAPGVWLLCTIGSAALKERQPMNRAGPADRLRYATIVSSNKTAGSD